MNPFALILGLGSLLGLWNMSRRSSGQLMPAGLLLLGLALLGARSGFVLLRLPYFQKHWLEIVHFSDGGLDGAAAILGALIGLLLILKNRRYTPGQMLEESARLLGPVAIAAWLGCWLQGTALGPVSSWPGMVYLNWPVAEPGRWPLPLMAALSLIALFSWLDGHCLSLKDKGRGLLYLLGVALSLLLVSLLRQDEPAPFWNAALPIGLGRWDVLETILVCLGCLVFWGVFRMMDERKVI